MTDAFIREKRGRFRHGDTQGGRPCEDRSRDWTTIAKERQQLLVNHQKPGRRKPGFFPGAFRGGMTLLIP